MASDNHSTSIEFPEYAEQHIRFKARQLTRHWCFYRISCEDIEQDLRTHVLERLPRYDSSRGKLSTFLATVINRRVASMVRYRTAAMRCCSREACSLNDRVDDGDGNYTDRASSLSDDAAADQRFLCLQNDVAAVCAELPDELQAVAVGIAKNRSILGLARELGIARSTVERRIKEIRARFHDAGLQEYL